MFPDGLEESALLATAAVLITICIARLRPKKCQAVFLLASRPWSSWVGASVPQKIAPAYTSVVSFTGSLSRRCNLQPQIGITEESMAEYRTWKRSWSDLRLLVGWPSRLGGSAEAVVDHVEVVSVLEAGPILMELEGSSILDAAHGAHPARRVGRCNYGAILLVQQRCKLNRTTAGQIDVKWCASGKEDPSMLRHTAGEATRFAPLQSARVCFPVTRICLQHGGDARRARSDARVACGGPSTGLGTWSPCC